MIIDELVGRPFVIGSQDCYGLVRDFYRLNYQIELTNYARPDRFWEADINLYGDNFSSEGFSNIDVSPRDYRVGDAFLMAIKSQYANHAAIYIGDGKILHHFYNRLSSIDLYAGVWRNTTVAVLRHKEVPFTPPAADVIDYSTLLSRFSREKLNV